jgi:hypothetical protein
VFEKMIKELPELKINQPTIVNGKIVMRKSLCIISLIVIMNQKLKNIMEKILLSVKDGLK